MLTFHAVPADRFIENQYVHTSLGRQKKQRTKTRTLVFRRDLAQLEEKPENDGEEDKFE